jgi:hypothetical protein
MRIPRIIRSATTCAKYRRIISPAEVYVLVISGTASTNDKKDDAVENQEARNAIYSDFHPQSSSHSDKTLLRDKYVRSDFSRRAVLDSPLIHHAFPG